MHIRIFARNALFGLWIATLTGCGASPVLGIPTPSNNPSIGSSQTPSTATPVTAPLNDLCSNPLLPVKVGATWTYSIAGPDVGTGGFTTTITNVRPDGFTVATNFADTVSADQQWACKPEGLLALSLASGGLAPGLALQGVTATLTTSNAIGVTIPAGIEPGMQWAYGLDITGNFSEGGISVDAAGTLASAEHAAGTESVTVPAGTFNAVKVQSRIVLSVMAGYGGIRLPITSVVNSTFWFAPGVGWIKSTESGDLPGTTINSTTELQSYTIP